jgi:RNA polymerase primary sigma factor
MRFEEIGKVLPNEEIVALIKLYRENNDYEARDKVIIANMGAVYSLAHKYAGHFIGKHVSFEDLVSDGAIGLIEAIDRFDTNLGVKFSTYFHWWVLKRITENIAGGPLSLPFHRTQIYNKFKKIQEELIQSGQHIDFEDIADQIGVSKEILIDTVQKHSPTVDNDSKNEDWGHQKINAAIIQKERLEDSLTDGIMFRRIKKLINKNLSDREKYVIVERFGLGENEPKTLEAIAKELDVSCEFVRVIQNKSIDKIKRLINSGRGTKSDD